MFDGYRDTVAQSPKLSAAFELIAPNMQPTSPSFVISKSILTEEVCMARAGKAVFDAQVFVANVGAGKRILEFQKNQNVFAQGEIADTVLMKPPASRAASCGSVIICRPHSLARAAATRRI